MEELSFSSSNDEGEGIYLSPADRLTDQIGTLRVLLRILRGVYLLRMGEARQSLVHFENATGNARTCHCWPLVALCHDLEALAKLRLAKPDAECIAASKQAAQRYWKRCLDDEDVANRWHDLMPKVEMLCTQLIETTQATAASRRLMGERGSLQSQTPSFALDEPLGNQSQSLKQGPDKSLFDELGSQLDSSSFSESVCQSPGSQHGSGARSAQDVLPLTKDSPPISDEDLRQA